MTMLVDLHRCPPKPDKEMVFDEMWAPRIRTPQPRTLLNFGEPLYWRLWNKR